MKNIGITSHPNPRLQCAFCGKWKWQFNRKHERIMFAAQYEDLEVSTKDGYLADVCAEHYDNLYQQEKGRN